MIAISNFCIGFLIFEIIFMVVAVIFAIRED